MALQDLTPQLRTRLSRMERLVGLFASLATLLLLTGFAYYIYHTAQRRGWLVTKVPYYTLMDTAAGLRVGDPVKLMGFEAGEITQIIPMPPENQFHIYVAFIIQWPYFGYIWNDSEVRVGTADLLGNRFLEISKGGISGRKDIPIHATYKRDSKGDLVMLIDPEPDRGIVGYKFETVAKLKQSATPFKGYFLIAYETPAIGDQITRVIKQLEAALPNVLELTNKVAAALTNSALLASNLNLTVDQTHPILSNVLAIRGNLREPEGSMGRWLLPPDLARQIQTTLGAASGTLTNVDTNFVMLSASLYQSLEYLAQMTSNLNAQVQANSLVLSDIAGLVSDTDDLVQGMKRHWLLKGAFSGETNNPTRGLIQPTLGGQK